MLVMRPGTVRFGGEVWRGVERVSIDSSTLDGAETWGNRGAHPVFADSVRRRSVVRVVQEIGGDDLGAPGLGALGELTVVCSRGSDAQGREIVVRAVVQSVSYSFGSGGARREVRLVAVSTNGSSDPVSVVGHAGGGGV